MWMAKRISSFRRSIGASRYTLRLHRFYIVDVRFGILTPQAKLIQDQRSAIVVLTVHGFARISDILYICL